MTGAPHSAPSAVERRRLKVRGLVQGVGFRPFVYRLAQRFDLDGFVNNGPDGVVIEVQGRELDGFENALQAELPPLARIDTLLTTTLPPVPGDGFEIRETEGGEIAGAAIPADSGLCPQCLEELFDPANRRHLHPFIACTDCGPRYTMTRRLPYDRDSTSMADFTLCEQCEAEYTDPASRRFHAEPICCHHCGPVLSQPADAIATALERGDIVAIKGIGGFHLACDAGNDRAVRELRRRKRRDGKPFAVMVLNRASAARCAQIDDSAANALMQRQRPVVVVPGRGTLSGALSPGLDTLGMMLPYTGLHYLLFHALLGEPDGSAWLDAGNDIALVMTSANLSGDPLITDNGEAVKALADIADLVVTHDREIAARADDSVLRMAGDKPVMIRRARGYAPNAVPLAADGPAVLATGAHLKNTLTLARGEQAWMSPHVGDLETPATLAFEEATCRQLLDCFRQLPDAIACDWHRDYASTRLAERLAGEYGVPLLRVQHHHAHLAAVLAVNGHQGPALGIALDGHGLGDHGESWGGELLRMEADGFQRLGHFAPLPLPGGDTAAREPWRLAAGALHLLGRGEEIASRFSDQPLAAALAKVLEAGEFGVTTAAGRLFDCAAGLLGVSRRAAFEGEPPMQLESLVSTPRALPGGYRLNNGVLDFTPLLSALADSDNPRGGAELTHGTLLEALVAWATAAAADTGLDVIALAGGCMLNRYLAESLPQKLEQAGLRPLVAVGIPPNDGSISLGQAWVARQMLAARKPQLEVLD